MNHFINGENVEPNNGTDVYLCKPSNSEKISLVVLDDLNSVDIAVDHKLAFINGIN